MAKFICTKGEITKGEIVEPRETTQQSDQLRRSSCDTMIESQVQIRPKLDALLYSIIRRMIHLFLLWMLAREGSFTDAFTTRPHQQVDCLISKLLTNTRSSLSSKPSTTCLSAIKDTNLPKMYERERSKLGKVPIISRTIPISINLSSQPKSINATITLETTIWEMESPSDMIQTWWTVEETDRAAIADPFGVVMWPGSIVASQELMKRHYTAWNVTTNAAATTVSPMDNLTVLVLGAGTGVEVQIAALLGAKQVIATDINPFTLKLLDYGASQIFGSDGPISNVVESKCECFNIQLVM